MQWNIFISIIFVLYLFVLQFISNIVKGRENFIHRLWKHINKSGERAMPNKKELQSALPIMTKNLFTFCILLVTEYRNSL